MAVLASGIGEVAAAFAPIALMTVVVLGWVPSRIEIGDDGILVRWVGWRRFIPWSDVAEIVPIGNGMEVKQKNGSTVLVASSFFRMAPYPYQAERRAKMLTEVDNRLRAHRASPHEAISLVARGSRSVEDWLAAIRALLSEDGGYRAPSISREALWRVAEDPAIEESARIGAAIALRSGASDDDRARLRVVASSTVSPKVRVALDAAAAAPDEELEAKLQSLDG